MSNELKQFIYHSYQLWLRKIDWKKRTKKTKKDKRNEV